MDERLHFPATKRNSKCIGDTLIKYLPENCKVLEIASGSGEHGVEFQRRLPSTIWQTSDPLAVNRKSIIAWIKHKGLEAKMPSPLNLNVNEKYWIEGHKMIPCIKSIICINMLHVSSMESTNSLFKGASNYLEKGCLLIIYGPFKKRGNHISKSNEIFDESLKKQNPEWGLRDLEKTSDIGFENGFELYHLIDMPANNILTIFKFK